ncbi:MAG: aldehyde-activating protein [Gammaproteobacteria bacterium]|nr:MAG: aldehyde-activating protein [Gammaproteobacteria bacterium]
MIKGSCLCGEVHYEFDGVIDEVAICHCDQCKRAQGTPFVTNAPVEEKRFSIVRGAGLLKTYFSSPNKKRVFCSACGSPFYSQRTDMPETVRLRLGTVTEGHIPEPSYEIFCESQSAWLSENLSRPRYGKNTPQATTDAVAESMSD